MRLLNRGTVALLLIAGLVLPFGVACERDEGPVEELGEDLDDVVDDLQAEGEDLGDQLEDAGEDIEDAVEEVKQEVDGDG